MVFTHKKTTRFLALIMMIMFCASIITPIASARASNYINNFGTNLSAGSNGNVTVSFNIMGTGTMTDIGSTRIEIRENNTLVATYLHTTTSGMMGSNKVFHSGTVTYKGVAGRTYRATVTFRAANSNGSDSRTLQSNSVVAR